MIATALLSPDGSTRVSEPAGPAPGSRTPQPGGDEHDHGGRDHDDEGDDAQEDAGERGRQEQNDLPE